MRGDPLGAAEVFRQGWRPRPGESPEAALCRELGVELLFDVGGSKVQSSSALVARQWGFYEVLSELPGRKVKRLVVNPRGAISLQKHQRRSEHWVLLGEGDVRVGHETRRAREGAYVFVPAGQIHRLGNPGPLPLEVIEVQVGDYCGEDDIVRIED